MVPVQLHPGGHDRYALGSRARLPQLGYVFQEHRLLPWRRVRENIALALDAAAVERSHWDTRIDRYLGMLKISNYADSWPLRMSGGQRQRASIARALAVQPDLILMDEPFSTLDEVTARTLRQEVLQVRAELGLTILLVTHSIREAVFMADRVVVLSPGPAHVLFERRIGVPSPRNYEDPELLAIETEIIRAVLEPWGQRPSETVG